MSTLSVVIPTYNRDEVLTETIGLLLRQSKLATEILIVDQTDYIGDEPTYKKLSELSLNGDINWIRLTSPSITRAMNVGLTEASTEYVLFLDDDVVFEDDFLEQHYKVLSRADYKSRYCAHVGQIIQPWQSIVQLQEYRSNSGLNEDLHFPFHCDQEHEVVNCMAGNLCIQRDVAISVGGFDERFDATAYRFETEFCRRLCRLKKIRFLFTPSASLQHLHVSSGGARAYGNFLTAWKPIHSACNYYFALLEGNRFEAAVYIFRRFCLAVVDKFYLRKPWWIPVRWMAEIRGLFRAIQMKRLGSILLNTKR